jgi:excisionase family DNA binding protein
MSAPESVTSKPRWYSIKEAAEYLDIGEPTIYRWMKEGKITYRKVGDSTRFWQEDLDAVMEVFHCEKDIEKTKAICPLCHVGELVEGVFRTTGLNYFQPKKTKFWTLQDSNIPSEARMCTRCGAIHLFGDVKKLNELRQSQTPVPGDSAEK